MATPKTQAGHTAKPGTSSQRKLYETLLAGLLDFVWGKGRADIQRQLQQATPDSLATIIGHITFALVQQGAEQGEKAGHAFGMDMLMEVAMELIQSLEKMAAAMNLAFDPHAVSLQAMVQALNDYADTLPRNGQTQQEAADALQSADPAVMQEAGATLQTIGERHGIDLSSLVKERLGQGEQSAPAPTASPQGLMGAGQ